MIELFIMTILVTVINYTGIFIGYLLGSNRDSKENNSFTVLKNVFGQKETLEEAFVPDED